MKMGDEVICVRRNKNPYTLDEVIVGNVYVIRGMSNCHCSPMVNVGFPSDTGSRCTRCGYNTNDKIWWNYASRFVPLDKLDRTEVIEKVNENY